jgi:hypothetical protein
VKIGTWSQKKRMTKVHERKISVNISDLQWFQWLFNRPSDWAGGSPGPWCHLLGDFEAIFMFIQYMWNKLKCDLTWFSNYLWI